MIVHFVNNTEGRNKHDIIAGAQSSMACYAFGHPKTRKRLELIKPFLKTYLGHCTSSFK